MKVSIIIPIYNVAPYIRRCLDSVVSQTFNNLECILVDDCGTDASMQIVRKYVSDYQGDIYFVAVHHQENQGLSAARNTGITVASGEYIYFLDSDDAITPDCMETLVRLAVKYPDADWVQGNTVKGNKELHEGGFLCQMPEYCNDKATLDYLILGPACTKEAWNIMLKRTFVTKHTLLFPSGIVHEDLYWRYFLSKATQSAAFANSGTYLYYRNTYTITTSRSKSMLTRRYQAYIYCAECFLKDINNCKSISKYQFLYFIATLFDGTNILRQFNSIRQWADYWMRVVRLIPQMPVKRCRAKVILFMFVLPPLCFLAGADKVRWRVKHYVFDKLWENTNCQNAE